MKKSVFFFFILFSLSVFSQDRTSATWNAFFTKEVKEAYINGKYYRDISVEIESSKQGYTTTYTSGWLAGYSNVTHPWVKIKVRDSKNKKIYSKKLKRSCLFIFDSGRHIQIGQPDNITTEAILKKKDNGWYMEFDEGGGI